MNGLAQNVKRKTLNGIITLQEGQGFNAIIVESFVLALDKVLAIARQNLNGGVITWLKMRKNYVQKLIQPERVPMTSKLQALISVVKVNANGMLPKKGVAV